ncbi:MAG: hypothetical protein ACRBBP_09510 [Bdellovibrionales bacterium]
MKSLILMGVLFVSSQTLSCDEPASEQFIYNMLNFKKAPSEWRSVKGSTHQANRSWDILLHVGRGLEDSFAIYKGETHTIDEAEFCKIASNKMRVTHPEHGAAVIERRGFGDESILIGRKGIFTLRFRPEHVVTD